MSRASHPDPLSLHGRVALVTGAAGGIGGAVARRLAAAGAELVVTDLPVAVGRLEELAEELAASGRAAFAYAADLQRESDVRALVASATTALRAPDLLVNVAGIHAYPTPLLEISIDQWERILRINLTGPLLTCQAAIPAMVKRGWGVVVNVASDSAFDVIPDEGPYGISKSGVVRLSAYLAKELAGTGVRVNSIAPGWVKTPMSRSFWSDPDVLEAAVASIPARRMADADDISRAVLFLVSSLAEYVSGHCLIVDGGRIAGVPA
jgi:NAD(P)-dependent dehydrogenase (short-subunit alcohol dehydrogenase family)